MKPTCQRCGTELVEWGEPDADGMVDMICPASPLCNDVVRTRKKVAKPSRALAGKEPGAK